MTSKTSYTKEEWSEMLKAPFYAGSIIATADMGRLEISKERHAAVKGATLWEIPDEAKDLIAPLYADIGKFREDTNRLPGYTDVDDPETWKPVALQRLHDVMSLINAKATPDEIGAFKDWMMYVAEATAEASKEGALGLIGPRVSDKEKAALEELRLTLDSHD